MTRDYRDCKSYRNGICGICRDPYSCPDYSAVSQLTDADREIWDNAQIVWRDNRRNPDVFEK